MAVAAVVFAVLVPFIIARESLTVVSFRGNGDCITSMYDRDYDQTITVHASYGDVMLTDTSLVLICINSQWAIVDGEKQGPTVPDTLCRQLGFEDGSATFERSNKYVESSTLWLQNIHCPVDYQAKHILRCTFNLSSNVDRSFEMHLRCSSNSTRHPGTQHNENTYIGQVALVPPFYMLPLNLSRSWGVITIKHYSGRRDYIRYTGGLLTLNDTDTICREMGYTHSVINSLKTVESLQYPDNYFKLNAFGRISSSQFSCLHSYQCAGCCFNATIHDDQEPSLAFTYSDPRAFVIKCAFYTPIPPSTSPVSGGYKEICEASPEDGTIKNKDVCQSPSSDVSTGFALLVIIGAVVAIVGISVYYRKQRDDYARLNNHAGRGD